MTINQGTVSHLMPAVMPPKRTGSQKSGVPFLNLPRFDMANIYFTLSLSAQLKVRTSYKARKTAIFVTLTAIRDKIVMPLRVFSV